MPREGADDEPGPDDFVWQKLFVRWATPGGSYPTDDDEDAAEALAAKIHSALAPGGLAELNGFEHGAGDVDILVFGKATDADVDDLYDLVAPVVREHGCPPGSSIVRCYNETGEELESDVLTESG